MIARILIAHGAAGVIGSMFLPYFAGLGAYLDDVSGEIETFTDDDPATFWELAYGADVALLVLGVVAALCALAGLLRVAALAAAALAGYTVIVCIDGLAAGSPHDEPAFWLMPAGGLVALAGAALGLWRQRRIVAS